MEGCLEAERIDGWKHPMPPGGVVLQYSVQRDLLQRQRQADAHSANRIAQCCGGGGEV